MKKNERTIHVIGLNSLLFEDLPQNIQNLVKKVNYLAVPETYSNEIKNWITDKSIEEKNLFPSKSNVILIEWLKSIKDDVILISRGDPLWFGIGRILIKNFSQKELTFYPANTCIQLAFSKLKKSWQGTKIISIHGRETIELIKFLKLKEESIAILTDPKNKSLELIRKNLKELNLEDFYELWLFEELGYKREKISLIKKDDNLPPKISSLNLVVLLKKENPYSEFSLPLFGINDNYYQTFNDRPNLITKRNVRIQILADLELPEFGTLLDIGSGCGTIGLEALRIRPKINLICIDKRLGTKVLINENSKKLKVTPRKIIEDDIKQYPMNKLKNYLSNSNRIIIGGCDKDTKVSCIVGLSEFLETDDIIVLPIIAYEALQSVSSILKQLNYEININLIQTFKGISILEGTRFEPNNPVFIVKAKKK